MGGPDRPQAYSIEFPASPSWPEQGALKVQSKKVKQIQIPGCGFACAHLTGSCCVSRCLCSCVCLNRSLCVGQCAPLVLPVLNPSLLPLLLAILCPILEAVWPYSLLPFPQPSFCVPVSGCFRWIYIPSYLATPPPHFGHPPLPAKPWALPQLQSRAHLYLAVALRDRCGRARRSCRGLPKRMCQV